MKFKSMGMFVLLSLSATFSSYSSASGDIVSCIGCSSNEMKQRAIQNGNGPVHVVDTINGIAKKYVVTIESEFGFAMKFAAPVTPDPYILNTTRLAADALTAAKHFAQTSPLIVPAYVAQSAYNLSNDSRVQRNVIDYINNNSAAVDKFLSHMQYTFVLLPLTPNIDLKLDVRFTDGSKVRLSTVGTSVNEHGVLDMEYEVESATDSDNNTIPLTKDQINNVNSTFPNPSASQNLSGLASAAGNHNVTITIPAGIHVSNGESVKAISCSNVNGDIRCVAEYINLD